MKSLCLGLLLLVSAGCASAPDRRAGPSPPAHDTGKPESPSRNPSTAESPALPQHPAPPTAPPQLTQKMGTIAPTTLEVSLQELSLDPKALPPLAALDPNTLRKVMKTFTRSLGVQCKHCHDTNDFAAPTANKTIATHMWNDFTRQLADGERPLFCDSCHQGRATFLDRTDPKALGAWMNDNYVAKLRRVDGAAAGDGCKGCHGEPFERKIFERRWHVKRA